MVESGGFATKATKMYHNEREAIVRKLSRQQQLTLRGLESRPTRRHHSTSAF